MTDKIPTAEEAYKITENQIKVQSAKYLDQIVDRLNNAAKDFKYEAEMSFSGKERNAVPYIAELLKSVGYTANVREDNDPREGSWTSLTFGWGKPKK